MKSDRLHFNLDAAQWSAFVELLGAPAQPNPGLAALMARKAPWDKPASEGAEAS